MTGLELTAAIAAIVLVSSAVQSLTGFGFAVLATPLLALVLKPLDAVALSMALSTVCVGLLWPKVRHASRAPVVKPLFLAALAGLPLGLWAVTRVDAHALRLGIGAVTVATVGLLVWNAARPALASAASPPAPLTLAAGFAAGALTGALSMPGPPAVMLLTSTRASKDVYRATLTAFALTIYPMGVAALAWQGMFSRPMLVQSLVQLPVVAAGVWLGGRAYDLTGERRFAQLCIGLLALSGIICLARG